MMKEIKKNSVQELEDFDHSQKTVTVEGIKYKIIAEDQHRNGSGGKTFNVKIFEGEIDGKYRKMLAIQFTDDKQSTAVLEIEKLAEDEIGFEKNSWRGDYFENLFGADERQ